MNMFRFPIWVHFWYIDPWPNSTTIFPHRFLFGIAWSH